MSLLRPEQAPSLFPDPFLCGTAPRPGCWSCNASFNNTQSCHASCNNNASGGAPRCLQASSKQRLQLHTWKHLGAPPASQLWQHAQWNLARKSIFTRNLSLVFKHLQLPGPAPAPRPHRAPPPPALGHPGAAFPSWGTSSCRVHFQLLVLNRPLNPHQQYLPPLIKDGSNKHEIWTKMDFNKYCLGELAYP